MAQPSSAIGFWQCVLPISSLLEYLLRFISQSGEIWCFSYCYMDLVNTYTPSSIPILLNEGPKEQRHRTSATHFLKTANFRPVSASLLTMLNAVPDMLGRDLAPSTKPSIYLFRSFRVLSELIIIALWSGAFVTMLLPKGKDFRLLFQRPPFVQWDCAAVLAAIEM